MEHIIGIDVASEVSSVVVMAGNGRIVMETNIATSSVNLKQLVKSVGRPRQIVFEECCEAAWLYSILEPISDDVFVCNPKKNKDLSGHSKSDKSDAYNLAERARGNHLSRVWHGGEQFQILKERLRLYQSLTQETTGIKNKIKAVFRGRGIKVGSAAYDRRERPKAIKALPLTAQRDRVKRLGEVLDIATEQRKEAEKELVKAVKRNKLFKSLSSMNGVGNIFAATIIAEIGSPNRFRTRRQFWSYCGLAVTTYETAQYGTDRQERVYKKDRKVRTRGLVRQYNRSFKCVFKQIAMVQIRGQWRHEYKRLVENGVKPTNARLTLARKAAAIVLHLAKYGGKYDEALVFARK